MYRRNIDTVLATSRFILRILPIEVSCYASKEEISKAIQPLVEQNFPAETENPHKVNTGISLVIFSPNPPTFTHKIFVLNRPKQ